MTVTEETIRYIEENLSRKYPHPETLWGILGLVRASAVKQPCAKPSEQG